MPDNPINFQTRAKQKELTDLKRRAGAALLSDGWKLDEIESVTGAKMDRCSVCGGPSTRLCDGLIPRWLNKHPGCVSKIIQEEYPPGTMRTDIDRKTCDAPLCLDCSRSLSIRFYKFSDGTGECDRDDFCPECVKYIPEFNQAYWGPTRDD